MMLCALKFANLLLKRTLLYGHTNKFIHSPVDGHVNCFQFLPVMLLWIFVFKSLSGYMLSFSWVNTQT